jgi:hypothetical protein
MTTLSFFRSLIAACVIIFSTAAATAQTREIKEGEPIYLEIQNNPDLATIEVGHPIQFRTTSNVIVDGKEVVRAFSPAVGTVLSVERQGYNTAGNIKIEVRHIRAVDGQQVLVSGPINLSVPNIHTSTTVYVKNAVRIEVR